VFDLVLKADLQSLQKKQPLPPAARFVPGPWRQSDAPEDRRSTWLIANSMPLARFPKKTKG